MSAPTDKKTDEKKKSLSTKAKLWIIGVSLLVVPLLIWLCTEPSPSEIKAKKVIEPQIATIVITTKYPGVPLHLSPDQNIIAAPVMGNIGWERAVNGIPVKRFPVNGKPIDLVDPSSVGVMRTVAYRILENQGTESAELAYSKYRGENPSSDWFDVALSNRQ